MSFTSAGGDAPIDRADIIAGLIVANLFKVDTASAKVSFNTASELALRFAAGKQF